MIINQEQIEKRPLSASSLKQFAKSPKHYVQYLEKPFEKTDALILGSAIDCKVLTPENFEKEFLIYQKFSRRSNADKERWATMVMEAKDQKRTLITEEMMITVDRCQEALMDHDQARELIEHRTKTQIRLSWRDRKNKIPLIGYADFESKAWDTDFVVDLKTTKSADPNDFVRDALKFGYHIQCAAYLDAYKKTQYRFPTFVFLAVETSEPFNVSINICDERYVEKALAEYHGILRAFRYCMDHEHFDMGYEFRLLGLKDYFNMSIPGYHKPAYPEGFD